MRYATLVELQNMDAGVTGDVREVETSTGKGLVELFASGDGSVGGFVAWHDADRSGSWDRVPEAEAIALGLWREGAPT